MRFLIACFCLPAEEQRPEKKRTKSSGQVRVEYTRMLFPHWIDQRHTEG